MGTQGVSMKKAIIITVSIVLGMCITVALAFLLHGYTQLPDEIDYTPINISRINYNNYINNDLLLDYKDGQIAIVKRNIFSSKLLVKDIDGNTNSYDISTSNMQIQENYIAYIEEGVLYLLNTKTDENIQMSNNIAEFILMDDRIIYVCGKYHEYGDYNKNKVFSYSFLDEESELLAEDVEQIFVKNDCVYAVVVINKNRIRKRIINVDLAYEVTNIEVDSVFFYKMLPCGDKIIVENNAGVTIIDEETGQINEVFLSERRWATNHIDFICNDQKIFVSLEVIKVDGPFRNVVNDEGNGLWMIDPISHETKKISDTVYDRLFLFNDTELVGVLDGKAYKIDITTGEATEIK